MKKIRVAVLMGGKSSERDISLISGKEVVKNLDREKYDVASYDLAKDMEKFVKDHKKIDVVLPILHGKYGEDGTVQGFLELLGLPYAGSGVLSSAIAIDKVMTKRIYSLNNIPTPKFQVIKKGEKYSIDKIKVPCVIKPATQGSSMGTTIIADKKKIKNAIELAHKFDDYVLVEEFVAGVEITVPVLGNNDPVALPVIEIVPPKGRFFDREVKYNGQTQEIIPARISAAITKKVQDLGIKAHKALGCRGLSRTDMIIEMSNVKYPIRQAQGEQISKVKQPKIFILETNTLPGMTAESLFPKAAKTANISFPKLLDKLIKLALEK